jgi:hypothetical protein
MRLATILLFIASCFALEVQSAPLLVKTIISFHPSTLVQAAERSFTLINKTGSTISSVSAKQAGVNSTQDISVISSALAINGSVLVNINISGNACVFDLTVVMQSTTSKVLRGVDLCQTDALTLE